MKKQLLPGFGLSLGITVSALSLIVLLPLGALVWRGSQISAAEFWGIITDDRVLAAIRLSLQVSAAAALVNVVVGLLVAWVLVRYPFPGKRILDALVDLPFALPTAVAGITLTSLYSENGWIGRSLLEWGIRVAFTPLGIGLALVFIGFPFVVRTVESVLKDLDPELEEAAASLGATRWKTFRSVLLPYLYPSLLTGFKLAFARGLGEYGSVVFIAGNMPYKTEILPLLIMTKLEQFDYSAAMVLAMLMLGTSLILLLVTNRLQEKLVRSS